jgi:hypothetical protein
VREGGVEHRSKEVDEFGATEPKYEIKCSLGVAGRKRVPNSSISSSDISSDNSRSDNSRSSCTIISCNGYSVWSSVGISAAQHIVHSITQQSTTQHCNSALLQLRRIYHSSTSS